MPYTVALTALILLCKQPKLRKPYSTFDRETVWIGWGGHFDREGIIRGPHQLDFFYDVMVR